MKREKQLISLLTALAMFLTFIFPTNIALAEIFNVNYQLYGGTVPEESELETNYNSDDGSFFEFLEEQPTPELEGYGFMGWYYESSYNPGYLMATEYMNIYSTPSYSSGEIDIIAGYAPAATFYASGVSSNGEEVSNTFSNQDEYKVISADGDPNTSFESTVQFTETPKALSNYEFAYYYENDSAETDASLGNDTYEVSEITTIDDAPENADWARPDILNTTKIYKAKYNALYNFDANGGTWENDITKRKDTPKEIEDDEPTNGTREFLGWAEEDGTTVTYSEISDKDAGTTFYAIWEKIIPTYTLPIGLTANYGDTLSNIDLSSYSTTDGYFSWVDDTTNVGDIGNRLHLIRYTPFDTENYDAVEIEIAIKINKANPIIEVTPSATKIEKGEKLANSTLSGGTVKGINGETLTGSFNWINPDKTFNPSEDSEEHEVLFTPENPNYNTIKCTIIVSAKQSSGQGSAGSGSADSNQGSTNPPAKKKSNKGLTRYTIKATAQNGGEISPSGSFRVIKSKNVKFVITPDEGYEIDVLMVDDEQIENTLEYTFNNVQGPHTIHVTFKKETSNTDKGNDSSNSLGFNRSVHMAYFEGYENNSFLPDANLTRAETAAILCKILLTPIDLNKNYPTSFSDISSDAWHAKYIGYIESLGLIVGYGDETFRPNNLITRAELVSILCKIEGEDAIYSNIFTDINETHWAAKSIAYAYNKGWITGYPDGSFNPDAPVSRAEIAVILNKVLNRNVSKLNFNNFRLNQYTDIDESHWAYYDIMEATHTHEYTITNDGIEHWTN